MNSRVVVTGMGAVSPLGNSLAENINSLRAEKNCISTIPEWSEYEGLRTRLAGTVRDYEPLRDADRKKTRTMGRVSLFAAATTEMALSHAGLLDDPVVSAGDLGIAFGSCLGSTQVLMEIAVQCAKRELRGIPATSYMQVMSHTCAANTALYFGIRGRIIPTCSVCTSGSQAIGYSYESIKHGYQKSMIAGGAEELCVALAGLFDAMFATSTKNDTPELSPRPFDRDRDGIVLSEGASVLILEDLDRAKERGAQIHAEVVGFGTNSDGVHLTNPNADSMRKVMELSLESADLKPEQIDFIHAHATATDLGDIAESKAIHAVFGSRPAIGAIKSYTGHTLGACGTLESALSISMMNSNWYAPVVNLETVDERCTNLDYIRAGGRNLDAEYIMVNNFAFGGVNTSIVYRRWSP